MLSVPVSRVQSQLTTVFRIAQNPPSLKIIIESVQGPCTALNESIIILN